MNRARSDAPTLIAQVFRTMKREPNRFAAINASCSVIMNHTDGNLAHDVIRRLSRRWLEETKYWNSVVGHKLFSRSGDRAIG